MEQQGNANQQTRGERPNREQSGNGHARQPREREQVPVAVAREDSQPIAVQRPAMEQPAMEQVLAEPSVLVQPDVREHVAEEITRTEFAPAAPPEQRTAPEPVMQEPEVQPVTPQSQPAPARRMDPVALPSDLVMIESRSRGPSTYQEPETPRPARSPRPRYQPPAIAEEPLQQVETGKERSAGSDAA
jgi:hypothetical protein